MAVTLHEESRRAPRRRHARAGSKHGETGGENSPYSVAGQDTASSRNGRNSRPVGSPGAGRPLPVRHGLTRTKPNCRPLVTVSGSPVLQAYWVHRWTVVVDCTPIVAEPPPLVPYTNVTFCDPSRKSACAFTTSPGGSVGWT